MKITHKSSYPKMVKDKKTGSQKSVVMHVYRITNASETEIALYKSLKGDYYKADDDGTPLYWSTKFVEGSAATGSLSPVLAGIGIGLWMLFFLGIGILIFIRQDLSE